MRNILVVTIVAAALSGCATSPGNRALVIDTAPRVSEFRFDDSPPLSAAIDFDPWADLAARNAGERSALDACLGDRDACETGNLLRYRRLLEIAAGLDTRDQLELVQEYFNTVDQKLTDRDAWASLYRVASLHEADCKGIALGKYFTLRELGWSAADLRVVMEWDDREQDWHAILAARVDGRTYLLDSILGLQQPRDLSYGYMVYSISDEGIWDHAPDFVPVP